MKFLSRLDDFEHIVIDGSVSGTGLSSLYLKDTATPILRIGNNTGDAFITYDGSELSISSDVDLRFTTPTDQDVFLITSSGNISTTAAGGIFTIGGGLTLPAITGGFLKTDANGVVSVDNSSYLTNETDTLDSVTGRGNTTTNDITVNNVVANSNVTSANNYLILDSTDNDRAVMLLDASNNLVVQTGTASGSRGILFNTEGAERMRIAHTGNVGIGTTSPDAPLTVTNNTVSSYIINVNMADDVDGGGFYEATGGMELYLKDTSGTGQVKLTSSGSSYLNGGNVGIGTTSPATRLDVVDAIPIITLRSNNDSYASLSYYSNNLQKGLITYHAANNALQLSHKEAGTTSNDPHLVIKDGNVGIGTTSPSTKLEVSSSGAEGILISKDTGTPSNSGRLFFETDTVSEGFSLLNSNGLFTIRSQAQAGATSGNTRVTIDGSGNVGIGTSSPTRKLHVAGTGRFTDNLYSTSTDVDGIKTRFLSGAANNSTNNGTLYLQYGKSNPVSIGETGSSSLYVAGNVGIGTTNPANNLEVSNSNSGGIGATLGIYNPGYNANSSSTINIGRASDSNWEIKSESNTDGGRDYDLIFSERDKDDTAHEEYLRLKSTGALKISSYGSNTFTGTAAYALAVDSSGNVIETAVQGTPTGGSGTAGKLTKWDTSSTLTDSVITESSGNIGIGASSPLRKLHVVGNFAVNAGTGEYYGVNITGGEGANPTILIGDWHNSSANLSWDSTNNLLRIDAQHSTNGAPIVFSGNDAAIEYGRFTATGNFGIGTTSPFEKLHVDGRIYVTSNPGSDGIVLAGSGSTNNPYAYIVSTDEGSQDVGIAFYVTTDAGTTNTEALRLDDVGNIQLPQYTAGLLKTDANGNVSLDTSTYLTSVAFSDLTSTPTTIAGYGITDALELGTTSTTALAGDTAIPVSGTDFDPVGTDNSTDVTLVTTSHDYLTLSGQEITLGAINLDDLNGGATAGILTTNTSGVVSVDTSTYLTSYTETDTLDSVTDRGNSTTNGIAVAGVSSHNFISGTQGFSIESGDATITTYRFDADRFRFYSGNFGEIVSIKENGNLGLGITNPSQRLSVNGNIQGYYDLYLGADKTSGATILQLNNYDAALTDAEDVQNVIKMHGRYWTGNNSQLIQTEIRSVKERSNGNGDSGLAFATQDGGNAPSEKMRIAHDGNVGIGTSSPQSKLHIVGDATANTGEILAEFRNSNNDGRIDIRDEDGGNSRPPGIHSPTAGFGLGLYASATNAPVIFYAGGIGSERMRISGVDGNVGIGTTSPDHKLTVYTDATSGVELVGQDGGNQNSDSSKIIFNGHAQDNGPFIQAINTSAYGIKRLGFFANRTASDYTTLPTESMSITHTGNVGIGTDNPSRKLHVSAGNTDIAAKFENTSSNGTVLHLQTTGDGKSMYFQTDHIYVSSGAMHFGNDTGDLYLKPGSSNGVGINTTNPTGLFNSYISAARQITHNGNGGDLSVISDNNSAPVFYVKGTGTADLVNVFDNTTEVFTIKDGGNVGIGTASPGAKLQLGDYPNNNIDITTYPDVPSEHMLHLTAPETTGRYGGGISFGENTFTAANITVQDAGSGGSLNMLFGTRHTSGTVQERMRITSSGNVGIGNTDPDHKLDVSGDIRVRGASASLYLRDTDVSGLQHRILAGGNAGLEYHADTSNVGAGYHRWDIGGGSSLMYLNESGNLGIGTTPSSWGSGFLGLDLGGSTAANIGGVSRTRFATNLYYDGSNFKYKNNYGAAYYFQDGVGMTHTWGTAATGTGGNTATLLERMRITSGGNVAIGTTTANTLLSIDGQADNGVSIQGIGTTATRGFFGLDASGDGYFYLVNGGTFAKNIQLSSDLNVDNYIMGDLGIGTNVPGVKLDVVANSNVGRFTSSINSVPVSFYHTGGSISTVGFKGSTSTNDYNVRVGADGNDFIAYTNNSERLRISSGGNVGIGTTNPTQKLTIGQSGESINYIRIIATTSDFYIGANATSSHLGVTNGAKILQTNSYPLVIGTTANQELYLGANNATIATLVDGKFGIGTTTPATKLHVVGTAETRLRVGSSNASSNVVLELRDENTPTGQGTVITYNNATGETYFNNAMSTATTDFHFQSGEYGTANDFFTLSNSGGNSILHLKTTSGDSFITYEDSTNELAVASDGDLRLTTPTDQDVFFISSGGNIDMTQAGGTVDMGGNLVVDGDVGIGTASPIAKLSVLAASTGYSSDSQIKVSDGSTSYYGGLSFDDAGSTRLSVRNSFDGTGSIVGFGFGSSTDKVQIINGTGFIVNEGNVGIGTTSPTGYTSSNVVLHINTTLTNSDLKLTNGTTGTGAVAGGLIRQDGNQMYIWNASNGFVAFGANNGERMRITSTGNVGIGTTNPSYKLTVDSGTSDIGIVTASSDSGSYVGFLDNVTSVIPKVGAVGNKLILDASQYVGVRRTDPSYALDVSGTIRATGDVIAYSDARVKENVETIPNALDKVKAMRGVGYNKIGEEKRSIGVIAQEMLEVMPEVVSQDEQGMYSVAYGNLVGVLIESIKELEAKVEQLENKLDVIAS